MSALTHAQLVKNFKAIRVLGEGSFGKVFLVRHYMSNEQFAVKKYSKYHILKNGKQKSLIRSSKILQSLENVNIIKFLYYSIGQQDDQIFLIFEACQKGSLQQFKQKIFRIKQMSLVKQIMFQLAQALKYLSSMSVAHRDLKPSNIAFTSSGQLKVIDFDQATCFKQTEQQSTKDEGFSKQLSDQTINSYSRRSRANSYVGTEMYMSPQMRNLAKTDERGDIWGYGCILFQLVTGRSWMPEYEARDNAEQIIDNLNKELSQFQIQKEEIDNIIYLLKNILQENPEHRISVSKIMEHKFFQQLRDPIKRKQYRTKFVKFLRANDYLIKCKNNNETFSTDLIGMKPGLQKYLELSPHPVLLQKKQFFQNSNKSFVQRFTKFFKRFVQLPNFKICYIIGGPKYFKERSSINQSIKSYMFYDQIDSIRIQNDSLIVEGNNKEKWNVRQNFTYEKCEWRYTIKSITNNQVELGRLYQLLNYIWKD